MLVSSVTTPETGENSKSLRINWTVINQGIGDTAVNSWTDRIIASKDNILGNSDDIALQDFSRNGLLNVGGSYSRNELITITFSFGGDYNLFVVTDYNQNVYEATQENNNSSAAIPLDVIRKTPDLQVTQINVSTTATSGQPFTVTWKVENLGENTINSDNWYDEVFLSTDQILNEGDIYLDRIYQSPSLAPSSFYQSSGTFTLPADIQGNYYVLVRTDSGNFITEDALENNNIGVTVNPTVITLSNVPDLVISNITVPTQAVPSWLNFNPATRTFNGIPTADSAGTLNVVVTATDTAQASVSNAFSLTILENQLLDNPPTVNQPLSNLTVNEDAVNTIIDLSNIFSDVDGDAIAKTIFANTNADLVTATIVDNQLILDYRGLVTHHPCTYSGKSTKIRVSASLSRSQRVSMQPNPSIIHWSLTKIC
ncbi:putative Ig domain-containing protein [Nostoc flagelliforme FACHB-838]|uniref:Ig domain-containing protein n=1 Tax=Nostoc flagelliforme FACHB-838 TaxID=2692904 RepID=A0ABR8DPB9_9NOSO|nr:CARDB domain-containing protein [Nostoc flagelliforme]MBD2531279.1 putative Ig domain-containing protein [Nostoc flagelliforme FACHB-838]